MQEQDSMKTPDWSGSSGDIWARRWRDTDRALDEVGAALDQAISEVVPPTAFRALDIGCGPGTSSLSLAVGRPDASILGCDLSQALVAIARQRAGDLPLLRFTAEDAEAAATRYGPFDLIFSRHGVMFFDDPYRAFRTLRGSAARGAAMVFSCFRSWELNPWASELAAAAAGGPADTPGREPSGFAFADADYVRDILHSSGWQDVEARAVDFHYLAGSGSEPVTQALEFLAELGPAARIIEGLAPEARDEALERMRAVICSYEGEGRVQLPGAAWIWIAKAT